NIINSITQTFDGSIWFATENGLFRYLNDSIIRYYKESNENSITSNRIFSLADDKDKNIWIGTEKGLDKINVSTNEIIQYNKTSSDSKLKLSDERIYSLLYDTLNILWIGTSNGLNKLNLNTDKLEVITEFDGLANNVIYSLQDDNLDNLWLTTNKGISKINKSDGEILNFDIIDGVHGYDFLIGGSYKTYKDEILFAGLSGINYFTPEYIHFNKTIPNIVITAFELYSKNGKTRISVQDKDTVFIPLESNHFTIEFAALDYTRPEKSNYAYKLEGIEDNWINIGYNRKATFSNIPSGNYFFRVKGSNNDNNWNDEGAFIYLIVETTFWKAKYAYIIYIILFVVISILLFQYRTKSLRKSNKILRDKELAGLEIKKQREELIFKNKNITDSINYAKRIQEAIMPSEKFFKRILPSSFILYMPKDIVSGDFYWIAESNNKIFLAVVDCTGHGVPGAFMSLIGFELLRNITLVQKIEDPSEVLNMLNTGVANTFNNEEKIDELEVKDGMDMSFCVINKEEKVLEFAGAFNPIYLIRDNKIIEVKGDRYTVGLLKEDQSYTKHIVPLEGADMLYLFTDGYTDQFGGPEEKKYKFRRFRHLLLTIHKLVIPKQRLFLKESIEKWMGETDQVDDILVIGVNTKEL
ncbi:SpoIIE family protein phosphatase, partial [Bacteroidota bacterium]